MHPLTSFVILNYLAGTTIALNLAPAITEVEKYINESFIITCGAPYATNLSWSGPRGQAINATEGKSNNLHIQDRDGNYLSLVFESIEKGHKGNYTCRGFIDHKEHRLTFNLIVVKPITFGGPLDHELSLDQVTLENVSTTVKCEVDGDPAPKVVWQFKGKALPLDDTHYMPMMKGLYIKNVSYEDEGMYTCRAFQVTPRNSRMESRQIKLTVQHKPRWVPDNFSVKDRAYGYSKGIANITCHASARPPATYMWSRLNNDTIDTLDPNTTKIIEENDRSVLQVKMVDKSVLGFYVCYANNTLGDVKKTVQLMEGTKPSPPAAVGVLGTGVHSAQFRLHAVSNEHVIGYRIQYIKRNQREPIDKGDFQDVFWNSQPYSIISLEPGTEYNFRVAARNAAGLSDYSAIQTFITKSDNYNSSSYQTLSLLLFALPFLIVRRTF